MLFNNAKMNGFHSRLGGSHQPYQYNRMADRDLNFGPRHVRGHRRLAVVLDYARRIDRRPLACHPFGRQLYVSSAARPIQASRRLDAIPEKAFDVIALTRFVRGSRLPSHTREAATTKVEGRGRVMEPTLAQRIGRVLARRQRERSARESSEDQSDHGRRLARDRVVAELQRLSSIVENNLAELNDYISEAGVRIICEREDQLASAEVVYTFSVSGFELEGPSLTMSVDYTGALRVLLREHDVRSLILSSTVFSIDDAALMNSLVTLLEAQHY